MHGHHNYSVILPGRHLKLMKGDDSDFWASETFDLKDRTTSAKEVAGGTDAFADGVDETGVYLLDASCTSLSCATSDWSLTITALSLVISSAANDARVAAKMDYHSVLLNLARVTECGSEAELQMFVLPAWYRKSETL
ncbi:hypothetical protein CAPTEDRAFT_195910 [Capitella teleta]|uniref:Uncharacterized protein n=1 Tax=Capitella teleta TaxID=283909 RepID=R7V6F9_CAPTE|nr:hypothetical protein CAPTEDRAFT_195910 [Capitella teleta]|eukprot:ELU11941.1 hypothetical protein CAPTEDRAFT_195910 [Capitella teleta]